MEFKDNLKNFYEVTNNKGISKKIKVDKNYKNHYIEPCRMISIIGPTGCGKSCALLNFLERKNNAFYEIILFTGSTTDEPLYNLLSEKIDGIQLIENIEDLPDLTDYNDKDKTQEKLIIFDDIINLKKNELLKIQKFFNSSRKYGFTCINMAQNYQNLPIQIRRNTHIFILFRMNDINTINNILKNHNLNTDKDKLKYAYFESTKNKGDFFLIDLTTDDFKKYRHNFLDFIEL